MRAALWLVLAAVACNSGREEPATESRSDTIPQAMQLYPVNSALEDSTIFTHSGFTIAYIPKSRWTDTLNVIRIHADSSENSPIVALIGNRRTQTGWERVYVSHLKDAEGELLRISEDEWGVFAEDGYDSWLEIHYGMRGPESLAGWAKFDTTKIALFRSPDQDTVSAHLEAAQRLFAQLPDSLRASKGACPFECCTYREWDARHRVELFARERDAGAPIAIIPKGEKFQALTGNVHILEPAIVAVMDPKQLDDSTVVAGDTILLLDYQGEGWWHIWNPRTRAITETNDGWAGPPWSASRNHRLGNYQMEWWAKVRRGNGQAGWINVSRSKLGNTDACGA